MYAILTEKVHKHLILCLHHCSGAKQASCWVLINEISAVWTFLYHIWLPCYLPMNTADTQTDWDNIIWPKSAVYGSIKSNMKSYRHSAYGLLSWLHEDNISQYSYNMSFNITTLVQNYTKPWNVLTPSSTDHHIKYTVNHIKMYIIYSFYLDLGHWQLVKCTHTFLFSRRYGHFHFV